MITLHEKLGEICIEIQSGKYGRPTEADLNLSADIQAYMEENPDKEPVDQKCSERS